MPVDITPYVSQLSGELDDHAYKASDSLGRIGSEDVVTAMIELLHHPNPESRILAARTLGLVQNNQHGLEPLLAAIKSKDNRSIAGELMMAMEGFDVSDVYVELFRLYLFGSYKVSLLAKEQLDFSEFSITSRVIKKAEKHWKHYINNARHDEVFEIRRAEVETMLGDLKQFVDS
jgi:HEAT repeat protein